MVQQRQRSYEAAVAEIRAAEPLLQPAPIREYPREAIESVLERAANPEPRVRVTPGSQAPGPRVRVRVAPAELDRRSRRQSRVRVIGPTPENRTDTVVVQEFAQRASVALGRHVQQAARDVVVDTAESAGEEIGWARVLAGDENCAFCAMLAARGPIYRSEKSASSVVGSGTNLSPEQQRLLEVQNRMAADRRAAIERQRGGRNVSLGGDVPGSGRPLLRGQGNRTPGGIKARGSRDLGESFHDNCDCEVVLVRRGEDWPGREQQEWLERLWETSTDRMGNRLARNMFRRAYRLDGQFQQALAAAGEGHAISEQSRLDEATRTALARIDGPDDVEGIREARDAFLDQIKALNQQVRRPNRTR